jgi:F-type H+-transporting ATPase subunit b
MLVHVTNHGSGSVSIRFAAEESEATTTGEAVEEKPIPNPIAPEPKDFLWGGGAFLVFLFIMRLFLVPKVRKGMAARYDGIRSDFEQADATRLAAQSDVTAYETALAEVRAQAAARVDAARQQLDVERNAQIAEANTRIAAKRAAAEAEIESARAAVREQIASAVAQVTERTAQLAVGKSPDASVVREAVQQVMGARS